MRKRINIMLLLVIFSLTVSKASTGVVFGVCPFQNINKEKSLNWFADGVAESLSSDMKLANMVVVERLHIKDVINEIGMGQTGLVDEKSAVKSGMLVGASHLITGSYQVSKTSIRIVANIVTTETGVVLNTAKVTGSVDDLFSLQDALLKS